MRETENKNRCVPFSQRLKEALTARQISQQKLSEITGINKGTISAYINGAFEPKLNNIDLIARALNLNPVWLCGFEGSMTYIPTLNNPENVTIKIPCIAQKLRYTTTNCIGGEDLSVKTLDIALSMLKGVERDSLVAAEMVDDSMIGIYINPSDHVIFSKGLIKKDGLYAIAIFNEVTVKRLMFNRFEGTISILSENSKYPPITIAENHAQFIILGKVVGWIHSEPY